MKTDLFEVTSLPEVLRPPVLAWLERNLEIAVIRDVVATSPALRAHLPHVLACSPYVAEILERYPEILADLTETGRLKRALAEGEMASLFADTLSAGLTDSEFQRQLRRLRHRELVRIAWRDLVEAAPLPETLSELSSLADHAIRSSLARAISALKPRYGTPRTEDERESEFVVLGMGKLGGRELNFSSDIDLIFLFSEHGATDGPRSVSNEEYFRLIGQAVVGTLSKSTADGFVYRVDVRLRPFGDSGPLAVSAPTLETYLAQHGRDWERYAYVKARVINEWSGAADLYDEVLRPFVYRRYIDYGVFSSLRDMKALIEAEVQRREYQQNIKLGRGGIREIEFIVQSLQLVRGGTTEELQDRELLPSLEKLVRPGCLPRSVSDDLKSAYCFLRRAENRLQEINDRQTHDLPTDEVNRARLALAMGYPEWQALEDALNEQRGIVSGHFQNIVFRGADEPESAQADTALMKAWAAGAGDESFAAILIKLGYPDVPGVAGRLDAFRNSGFFQRLDESGRKRLNTLMPAVVAVAADQEEPAEALAGAMVVIEAIGRRSAYFSLLNENPDTLERLVRMCGMSDFLVQQVAAHPLLLDELLDQRIFREAPSRADLRREFADRVKTQSVDDPEKQRNALLNFQQAAVFRVAVADLSGTLPLMKVSDYLTEIAELVLQAALAIGLSELTAQYGAPRCKDDGQFRPVHFAIIAYGKLGGLELGYGSDLDLVFLHDSTGEAQNTDGEKSLDNSVFFVRLTRRIINILTSPTSSGNLYEVDTRLRPSGNSGLLVSSLSAFDRYQREDAWTWEHQALLRGRVVAGPDPMLASFDELRSRVLVQYVHLDSLKADVIEMRERMRSQLSEGDAELFDLKQDVGGVTDIEFIVQYLVLREARNNSDLMVFSDNIRQLEALSKGQILPAVDAETLTSAYKEYRRQMHHLALAGKPRLVNRDGVSAVSKGVKEIWGRVFD
jgi:glutamate-ammonia-ligase adenylyltransferase